MPVIEGVSGSHDPPRQYSQPSRKGKKAWRKNVDVSEVEKGLQEVNEEIIRGGLVADRDSKDLFTIDAEGDSAIKRKIPQKFRPSLRADEIIAQRSAVPPVSLRKRPGGKATDGLVQVKRIREGWVTHRELQSLRKVADGDHAGALEVIDAGYDIWDFPREGTGSSRFPFLPIEHKPKLPETIRRQPIAMAANGKPIPAVQKPAGGFSYNPTDVAYEERLIHEGAKAVAAERKRLIIEEEERLKREAAARSAAEAEVAEGRADLSEWDEDSAWEGIESGVDEKTIPASRPTKKTRAQRNRLTRQKEHARKTKIESVMRCKNAQVVELKRLHREVLQREQTMAMVQLQSSEGEGEGDEDSLRRKRLGKTHLPEKELQLVLPDELQDSLRLLRPEGNLLKDKYRNLIARGKMESRRRIPFKKQGKTKLTEKWAYKDFLVPQ